MTDHECIPSYNWTCLILEASYCLICLVFIIIGYKCVQISKRMLFWMYFTLGAGAFTCVITGIIQILFFTCVIKDKQTDDVGYGFAIAVVVIGFIMVIVNICVLVQRAKAQQTCNQCPDKNQSAPC